MQGKPFAHYTEQQSLQKEQPAYLALMNPAVLFVVLVAVKMAIARIVVFGTDHMDRLLLADLPSLAVILLLIEAFAGKRKFWKYFAANLIVTAILFAVVMYYKYFGVIVTYRALYQANQVVQVKASVWNLLHPYFLLLFVDLVIMLLLVAFNRKARKWAGGIKIRPQAQKAALLLLIPACGICFYTIETNSYIVNEWRQAEEMGILNYETMQIAAGLRGETPMPEMVDPESVRAAKGIEQPAEPKYWGLAEGRNVIVVQMEALQNFLIGLKVDGMEITPVLNRLAKESYYFPRTFQQVGSGNTSDAEFISNTSMYVPKLGPASQVYADKSLPSLPKLLKREKQYRSFTFHTNSVAFWNRDKLYKALGFDRYYDSRTFGDEDFVHFGSSDEVLYRKTAEILRGHLEEGIPFYANVISMSAHHPFELPERKHRISLPKRFHNTMVGDYLISQNYADYALGTFIDELKRSGLWDNSMIVIYGDHMGLPLYSLTDDEMALMQQMIGKPYSYDTMLNIPLMFIIPGVTDGTVFSQTAGQIDIMPTIANLLGVSTADQVVFGQDLLNQTQNLLGQQYYLPSGSFIDERYIFIPGKGVKDGTAFPIGNGAGGTGTVTAEQLEDKYIRARHLIKLSHAYAEQLPDRE